jgi:hypothetical protein
MWVGWTCRGEPGPSADGMRQRKRFEVSSLMFLVGGYFNGLSILIMKELQGLRDFNETRIVSNESFPVSQVKIMPIFDIFQMNKIINLKPQSHEKIYLLNIV